MHINTQRLSIGLAILLVIYNIGIILTKSLDNKQINYIGILIYFMGILFITYKIYQEDRDQSFGTLISKALRIVVVSTLFIVVWTFLSNYIFPAIKVDYLNKIKTDLIKANKSFSDIETTIALFNKNFMSLFISKVIFTYGVFGALFALISTISLKMMLGRTVKR